LLQSYLPGTDLGLNVLCHNGEILAFTVQENILSASPPFVPATATLFRTLTFWRLGASFCRPCGGTVLLEMNPRYWATLMSSVYAGVNFHYLSCLAALDRPFPPTDYQLITYTGKSLALKQALYMAAVRPFMAGFRFRNTDFVGCTNGSLAHSGRLLEMYVK